MQIVANRLTLYKDLSRVILEGDSNFGISDGIAYHGHLELDAEEVTALSRAVLSYLLLAIMVALIVEKSLWLIW